MKYVASISRPAADSPAALEPETPAISMISAIVLTPDLVGDDDTARLHEITVRSLAWLVTAVVAGVVRDVTLAAQPGLGLSEVADLTGCELVQDEGEAARLGDAIARARASTLLVMRSGYQPDTGLIDEIEALQRRDPAASALILSAPHTLAQRLFPDRAPIVGVLAPIAFYRERKRGSFTEIARAARRGQRLAHRARKII